MPEIGRIQSTNFQSLLTELGITRNQIPFGLQSEVMPVVLVGGTVSFLAAPTPAYRVQDVFTIGNQVAPAINTVMADTGPLVIGTYSLRVFFEQSTTMVWLIQMRNAANAVTLINIQLRLDILDLSAFELRLEIENDNERFRVLNAVAGTAAENYAAQIMARV